MYDRCVIDTVFDDASPPIDSRAKAAVDMVVSRFIFAILLVFVCMLI